MKLYHGSTCQIEKPDVLHSRKNLDFGRGFYLTSFENQAIRWAKRKSAFENGKPFVNVFNLSDDISAINVLKFHENDSQWVEFVCECRKGGQAPEGTDLIIGGVADDKVFEAVNMYFKGYWDMETTLNALKFYERNVQYCFLTQNAIDAVLTFETAYEVSS